MYSYNILKIMLLICEIWDNFFKNRYFANKMDGIRAGIEFHNWAANSRNDLFSWLTRIDLGTLTARSRDLGHGHRCLTSAEITTPAEAD